MKVVILDLDKNSKIGFAFNSLTTFVGWKDQNMFYADPSYWFNWCKEKISPRVTLLHVYRLYEWTIIVKKNLL